ncbi:hypothetical protein GN958_ATG11125 [Phytophthora infestans]|uniref:Uncharacterized protein n=1 Tax=Phytophthora infestans TaxID=4787 RepID=A0A8S9UFY8_PHYIN|nr:hypothetical protein GN958_ATG11125 [Phytophthora infestans]
MMVDTCGIYQVKEVGAEADGGVHQYHHEEIVSTPEKALLSKSTAARSKTLNMRPPRRSVARHLSAPGAVRIRQPVPPVRRHRRDPGPAAAPYFPLQDANTDHVSDDGSHASDERDGYNSLDSRNEQTDTARP